MHMKGQYLKVCNQDLCSNKNNYLMKVNSQKETCVLEYFKCLISKGGGRREKMHKEGALTNSLVTTVFVL